MNLSIYTTFENLHKAERWANRLGLPLISVGNVSIDNASTTNESSKHISNHVSAYVDEIPAGELHLWVDEEGLSLRQDQLALRGDFTRMEKRLKPSNLSRELLVKASRIKDEASPILLDATAGLGEDSLLLAAAGFRVHLYEYNPIIAALLQDSMERALLIPELADAVNHMTLHVGDSVEAMREPLEHIGVIPDVVLLDPMFPERQKSALVKKKFQLLQQLEAPCSTEKELLDGAFSSGAAKVVIKRPVKGPYLAGKKPGYSVSGKAVRYDCIAIPRKK